MTCSSRPALVTRFSRLSWARSAVRAGLVRALGVALAATLLAGVAVAAGPVRGADPALDEALRELAPLAPSGVLYDRVLPLAKLAELDGGAAAPVVDRARWRQAWDELSRASLGAAPVASLEALDAAARAAVRAGVLPIALFDRAYERVRPGALEDGTLRVEGGALRVAASAAPKAGGPLESARAVAAAVLAPPTYRGGDVVFAVDPALVLCDGAAPREIAVDFDDGLGLRPVEPGERVRVRYTRTGTHVLEARVTRADGSVGVTRFAYPVAALAAPLPDDTLHVTATIPYEGVYGTGEAYVALAPGHGAIVNPVVVIEGFDLDNNMYWDELYALLNQQDLLETLRADGYDAIVLNFTDATEDIQQNAFVIAELIQQVQAQVAPTTTLALVGASMGGLCSRYALAYMESHALPHRVRTFVSFDAPQLGADIPLGMQYWIQFFAGQSVSAADFLAALNRPASRQMLLYHLTDPPGATGAPDPLRTALLADLAANGDWPALPRLVAVANGSGLAVDQGFAPHAQIIQYEYSSLFAAVTGNVWALPDLASGTIFDGRLRILFSTTTRNVTVSNTLPWDGAPGGSRASMTQLDTTAAPYGDIVALHPSHCFIPTVSSLALSPAGPFFDVSAAGDLSGLTPFDAVFWPDANEEHVSLTAASAAFVRAEIAAGVLAVGPSVGAPVAGLRLAVGPNPFASSVRVTFTLPRAGRAEVRVYGVDGRVVRTLAAGEYGAGAHDVAWDGRDSRGARVAPGVYVARCASGGEVAVRRTVRIL